MSHIIVNRIEKQFPNGVQALRGVSMEIAAGSFTVLIGPSGAGKSTLLRMLNGLELPSSGTVSIEGQTLGPRVMQRIRAKTGMIFQHFNLVGRLSVMTNVLTGRLSHRSWIGSVLYLFHERDLKIAHHALERVGITEKAWERADRLSGGQQQRVGVARALAQGPRLILADEPVASLDPVAGEEIMRLLRKICDQDGITVLVSLHQVALAKRYADRIIGLNAGKIVFDGAPKALEHDVLNHIYRNQKAIGNEEHFEAQMAYA
jgi:phosphonate transport system ATP-binding protein